MKELHELKEKLCDELKEYGKKDLSAGSLDVIDKLAHTVKNLDKIIDNEGYSQAYGQGNSQGYGGNYTRRGMRGYSYGDNMVSELRELMHESPDERVRQEFKRFIQKIESM